VTGEGKGKVNLWETVSGKTTWTVLGGARLQTKESGGWTRI